MKTWLLLDCHFLAWRAFHTTGELSFGDLQTGVIYGFLRDVANLMDMFATENVAFCFDHGESKRKLIYPAYKLKRHSKELTEEELRMYTEFKRQIGMLRDEHLWDIGYRNVFCAAGYESDDIIASLCLNTIGKDDEAVIITADQDMFQLLTPNVCIYNPNQRKTFSQAWFLETYGIGTTQWVDVKAMAGCGSDEITGIDGVGEKTTIKYLTGKLPQTHKVFNKIVKGNDIWQKNMELVQLPFPGTPKYEFKQDKLKVEKWREVADRLGMKSLRNRAPFSDRGARTHGTTKQGKGFGL